jgi:hypothetical protein
MRRWAAWVVSAGLGAGLVACSSDSGTESAATSSTPDVCASADALRASVSDLGDVQVAKEGTDGLSKAWTTVQDDWADLKAGAGDRYSDQVDQVQTDVDAVRSAIDSARTDASAQTLGAAASAVGVFVHDADALVDEVKSSC